MSAENNEIVENKSTDQSDSQKGDSDSNQMQDSQNGDDEPAGTAEMRPDELLSMEEEQKSVA